MTTSASPSNSMTGPTAPLPLPLRRLVWRNWVVQPVARGLAGFPLALATLALGVVGSAAKPALAQRRLAQRFGGVGPATTTPGNARAVAHALAIAVPALVAFALSLMTLFLAWSGWLYPLKPELIPYWSIPFTPHPEFDGAWGGPTLVGAWFIHAMAAIGMQILCLFVASQLHSVQNVVTRRLLR